MIVNEKRRGRRIFLRLAELQRSVIINEKRGGRRIFPRLAGLQRSMLKEKRRQELLSFGLVGLQRLMMVNSR